MNRRSPEIVGPNLRIDVSVNVFNDKNATRKTLGIDTTHDAFTTDDEELPEKPIYVLRFKERFQIRLMVSYGNQSQLPVQNIESISFVTSEGKMFPLQQEILNLDSVSLQAIATVDPSADGLEDRLSICHWFGTVDERYRKMTVQVKFRIGDHPDDTLVKNSDVHFLIVGPYRKLRWYRIERNIQGVWSRMPDVAKKGMRLFGHGIFLIGFVLHGVHTEVYPMVTQLNVCHEQITTKERENWSGQFKGRKKIVQVGQIVQGEPMRESRVVKVICPAECIEMRTAEEMLPCFFVRASKATLAG